MIQITPQMRILVAIEAVDGRRGIDSLGAGVPGETAFRSVFRLPIHLPQPQRAGDPDSGL